MTDDELVQMAADAGATEDDIDQVLRFAEFLRVVGPPANEDTPPPRRTPEAIAYLNDPDNREWMGLPPIEGVNP